MFFIKSIVLVSIVLYSAANENGKIVFGSTGTGTGTETKEVNREINDNNNNGAAESKYSYIVNSGPAGRRRFVREEGRANQSEVVKERENEDGGLESAHSIDGMLPDEASLFNKETIDSDAFNEIGCHLRNIDFCYAGLLSGMQNALPETDLELEVRCDELQAASSCFSIFNKRCQTFKVFAALSPINNFQTILNQQQQDSSALASLPLGINPLQVTRNLTTNIGSDLELPDGIRKLLLSSDNDRDDQVGLFIDENDRKIMDQLKAIDLIQLCDPRSKKLKINRLLRLRLFEIGKCANSRINLLKPCIDDLKTALQLFYEPARVLPLKPSCCAIARFRQCAKDVLDNICGLSSFEQLEETFSNGSFGSQGLKLVNKICQKDSNNFKSPYCLDVLPPKGLKMPQRRGSKASKLAKVLDMISLGSSKQQQAPL